MSASSPSVVSPIVLVIPPVGSPIVPVAGPTVAVVEFDRLADGADRPARVEARGRVERAHRLAVGQCVGTLCFELLGAQAIGLLVLGQVVGSRDVVAAVSPCSMTES